MNQAVFPLYEYFLTCYEFMSRKNFVTLIFDHSYLYTLHTHLIFKLIEPDYIHLSIRLNPFLLYVSRNYFSQFSNVQETPRRMKKKVSSIDPSDYIS